MQCAPISRTAEARFGKIRTTRVLRRTSSNHLSSMFVERIRFLCPAGKASAASRAIRATSARLLGPTRWIRSNSMPWRNARAVAARSSRPARMRGRLACHQAQSPLNTALNAHLHAAMPNFMIHECFDDFLAPWARKVFRGVPPVRDGHIKPSDAPGIGVELDEEEAVRHPYGEDKFIRLFEPGWEDRRR